MSLHALLLVACRSLPRFIFEAHFSPRMLRTPPIVEPRQRDEKSDHDGLLEEETVSATSKPDTQGLSSFSRLEDAEYVTTQLMRQDRESDLDYDPGKSKPPKSSKRKKRRTTEGRTSTKKRTTKKATETEPAPKKTKRRGRPPGSKNKNKVEPQQHDETNHDETNQYETKNKPNDRDENIDEPIEDRRITQTSEPTQTDEPVFNTIHYPGISSEPDTSPSIEPTDEPLNDCENINLDTIQPKQVRFETPLDRAPMQNIPMQQWNNMMKKYLSLIHI